MNIPGGLPRSLGTRKLAAPNRSWAPKFPWRTSNSTSPLTSYLLPAPSPSDFFVHLLLRRASRGGSVASQRSAATLPSPAPNRSPLFFFFLVFQETSIRRGRQTLFSDVTLRSEVRFFFFFFWVRKTLHLGKEGLHFAHRTARPPPPPSAVGRKPLGRHSLAAWRRAARPAGAGRGVHGGGGAGDLGSGGAVLPQGSCCCWVDGSGFRGHGGARRL